jgi:hypothetical protein
MIFTNPTWIMPRELHNTITNRTANTRDLLFLIEHWDDGVLEFVIYPTGKMSLDRMDDFWDDTATFVPPNWEPT